MNTLIEKQIEEILRNRILDITDEYLGQKREEGVSVYVGYPIKMIEELALFAEKREKEVREELIKKYKPTLDDQYATDWLRSKYGLDDDDTLNAGEIEELLEMFIHDHSTLPIKEENQK